MSAADASRGGDPAGGSFLDALPVVGRAEVLAATTGRTYARGAVLLSQGDEADTLLIVAAGRVRVQLGGPDGERVTLNVLGPGAVLGEMGVVLAHHRRTADVEALDEVLVRVLRRDVFDRVRRQHPQANDFLLQLLARRVDRLGQRLLEAHHVEVDRRIARRLLEVGRLFADGHLPVVLPLTQEDVAQMAGTTRPTANHALKQLEAAGVVRLVRGRVELHDVSALRSRCS